MEYIPYVDMYSKTDGVNIIIYDEKDKVVQSRLALQKEKGKILFVAEKSLYITFFNVLQFFV